MIRTRCYKIFHLEMNINWQLQLLYMHLFTLNTKHLFRLPNQQSMPCQNDRDFYIHQSSEIKLKQQRTKTFKDGGYDEMEEKGERKKGNRRQLFSSNSSINCLNKFWNSSNNDSKKQHQDISLQMPPITHITSQSWLAIEIKRIYAEP